MNYYFDWSKADNIFAVPDSIVDKYINIADYESLKVLLYILKNKNLTTLNYSDTSKHLNMSIESIENAFSFWEQVGFLKTDKTNIEKENANIPAVPIETKSSPNIKQSNSKYLTPKEMSARITESSEISFLLESVQNSFGKTLTYTENRVLIWIHDYLGLKSDIILMIIEFCMSINKVSMGYIEKVAVTWHEKNIQTHEQAEYEILQLQKSFSMTGKILSLLGTSRTLSTKEKKYVDEWAYKNIEFDLIKEAYDKTIDSTGKPSFAYMNKIIDEWYNKGIKTIEQVKTDYIEYKNAKTNNFNNDSSNNDDTQSKHSYNLDLLMQHARENTPIVKEK